MSDILTDRQNPPFGWGYGWLKIDADGKPEVPASFKHPNTICIKWDHFDSNDRTRELLAEVVPERGYLVCEFAMHFKFPQFDSNIVSRLDDNSENHANQLYMMMACCLQGQGLTNWQAVIHGVEEADYTVESFAENCKNYI